MSTERDDSTYRPTLNKLKRQIAPTGSRPVRSTRKETDYTEQIVVSDSEQAEGAVNIEQDLSDTDTESAMSIKSEISWTPGTINRKTKNNISNLSELQLHISQAQMAQPKETSMADVMKLMLEMRASDKEAEARREIEREERARARDDERTRDSERREERMLLAIKEAQPAVPQTVNLMNHKLPKIEPTNDVEQFVGLFEAALRAAKIPEEQWCSKLHAHINTETKLKVHDTITNPDATYADIKEALLGYTNITFNSAAEKLMTADRGALYKLPIRQFLAKMEKYMQKLTKEAATEQEIFQYLGIAHARNHLNPKLKAHFEFKGVFEKEQFCRLVEEWQTNQPIGMPWHKSPEGSTNPDSRPTFKPNSSKKTGSCFHCGKTGHFSKECRTRLAQERAAQNTPIPSPTPVVKEEPLDTGRVKREITCFSCHKKGHKSPQCPLRQVKCVQVETQQFMLLKDNELMGSIGEHVLPVTCDSGADITIVPEECVPQKDFTGDTCEVASFNRKISSGKI